MVCAAIDTFEWVLSYMNGTKDVFVEDYTIFLACNFLLKMNQIETKMYPNTKYIKSLYDRLLHRPLYYKSKQRLQHTPEEPT